MYAGKKVAQWAGAAAALLCLAMSCLAQDLGEVARQQKVKKAAGAPAGHYVITNEDIQPTAKPLAADTSPSPKGAEGAAAAGAGGKPAAKAGEEAQEKPSAEEVKRAIIAQKQAVSSAEADVKEIEGRRSELDQALKGASGDCRHVYIKGTAWENACGLAEELTAEKNRRQGMLEEERKKLEEMQEAARHMGYGSAVYDADPD